MSDPIQISGLFVYPVKSLRGIALERSAVGLRGLRWDRHWMIVGENGRFMTQRQSPGMAQISTRLTTDALVLSADDERSSHVSVPLKAEEDVVEVSVWKWDGLASRVSDQADRYLSEALGVSCRLVVMRDDAERIGWGEAPIAFPDGGAILVAGEASLASLNGHLEEPVPMDRFRANIVLAGSEAYAEDEWTSFEVGELSFRFAKRCGRCLVTTADQKTGERHPREEPLRTLVRERLFGKAACFGAFYAPDSEGEIGVGDTIKFRHSLD